MRVIETKLIIEKQDLINLLSDAYELPKNEETTLQGIYDSPEHEWETPELTGVMFVTSEHIKDKSDETAM